MPAPNTASATEFIDRTTADAFIPEVWSLSALVEREGTTVFGGLVDRTLEKELRVGDTIYRPSISNLGSARTKSANTAITFVTVTESDRTHGGTSGFTGITLTVTTHDYQAIAIESIAKLQTNRDLMGKYAGKMGYSLALAYDNSLAGLIDNFSQAVGTLGTALTYATITRGIQYLDDANAPGSDRVIVLSPAEAISVMSLKEFVNSDYAKLTNSGTFKTHPGLEMAYQTSWWGYPIYRSTNVEGTNAGGHDNGMFHRESIVSVMQMSPKPHHHFDIDYIADKVVIEQVHGSIEQRDDHGVFLRGS